MSFTLHTTEIWLNTHTDSGGMKDRTHGIFLQHLKAETETNNVNKRIVHSVEVTPASTQSPETQSVSFITGAASYIKESLKLSFQC